MKEKIRKYWWISLVALGILGGRFTVGWLTPFPGHDHYGRQIHFGCPACGDAVREFVESRVVAAVHSATAELKR